MGFFSYKCAVSKKSIPHDYNLLVYLILPNNEVKKGYYNGYGHLEDPDTGEAHSILDLVSSCLGMDDPFGRRGVYCVKTGKEYFFQKDFDGYEDVLEDFGKTVNECNRLGLTKNIKDNFVTTYEAIKLVTEPHYKPSNSIDMISGRNRPPRYEELDVSEDCEHQGYFYPEDFDNYADGYNL